MLPSGTDGWMCALELHLGLRSLNRYERWGTPSPKGSNRWLWSHSSRKSMFKDPSWPGPCVLRDRIHPECRWPLTSSGLEAEASWERAVWVSRVSVQRGWSKRSALFPTPVTGSQRKGYIGVKPQWLWEWKQSLLCPWWSEVGPAPPGRLWGGLDEEPYDQRNTKPAQSQRRALTPSLHPASHNLWMPNGRKHHERLFSLEEGQGTWRWQSSSLQGRD